MDYRDAKKLAEIIIKIRLDKATAEEREMLLSWLDESEANRQTYKNIITGETLLKRLKLEERLNESLDWDAVCGVVARKLMIKEFGRKVVFATSIVAGCIVFIFAGWLFLSQHGEKELPASLAENSKVKLVMGSGKVINLDKEIPDSIDAYAALIVNNDGELVYQAKGEHEQNQPEVKNKIVTDIGGEYSFVLSDGTKVWLNALSEIEFPVNFKGEKRIVNLKGEAYFEVKQDSKRPFIVHSLNQTIQVLGTSFNIKAYENDRNIYTTLIEGSLAVGSGGSTVMLKPGMESVCQRETNEITTSIANTDFATAWRTGYFMFNNTDLDEILKVLSRWYGVSFIYDKPLAGSNTFSGRFSKYGDISTTLNSIYLTGGPKFKIDSEGKTIHITPE
ncbi:MAG: DUF4974 domain-containing protein [Rikenellaceae bacterium]|nr:DUF4974 domain-containing protein [Rikenellaceae bacterium]